MAHVLLVSDDKLIYEEESMLPIGSFNRVAGTAFALINHWLGFSSVV